jgi:hypothetical protein
LLGTVERDDAYFVGLGVNGDEFVAHKNLLRDMLRSAIGSWLSHLVENRITKY